MQVPTDTPPDITVDLPLVEIELDRLWDYAFTNDTTTGEIYDNTYDWRDDFFYGWDKDDDRIFGKWDLSEPSVFNIRRYYTGNEVCGPCLSLDEYLIEGNRFKTKYSFGYYDVLVWNEVETLDGIQSLHFDENTNGNYIMAYTNPSMYRAHANKVSKYAYYQPEFLYASYTPGLFISQKKSDYQYDEKHNTYNMHVNMEFAPRTYIYLIQVVLRNNNDRIVEIDNTSLLHGMANQVNLNTGVTGSDEVSVTCKMRMKKDRPYRNGEVVDIIGGRLFTFGLCGLNPSRATRAAVGETPTRNYVDLNVTFCNGMDSTIVFDVTEQVQTRFKGGIITTELDLDTVPIPSSSGGSGFQAVIEDFDKVLYEFDF